ncbi:hypothetical protein ASZ78_010226 [Callipepla squamata]|uniref:Uncharacterized protein n=1 Tax=Callipepla squamata TaxID=9009 RepID=A0A226N2C2_CALSU|nr:hypothetical protein ASZ78_010226 [Callipepla squamata]
MMHLLSPCTDITDGHQVAGGGKARLSTCVGTAGETRSLRGSQSWAREYAHHHRHRCKSAHLLLRIAPTLGPATLATQRCHPAPLGFVPQVTLHLAITHQATIPTGTTHRATTTITMATMGIPHMAHQGAHQGAHLDAHQAPMTAIRSTRRSTRRSTPSVPTSITEASTQAAQAARAALILTEENIYVCCEAPRR